MLPLFPFSVTPPPPPPFASHISSLLPSFLLTFHLLFAFSLIQPSQNTYTVLNTFSWTRTELLTLATSVEGTEAGGPTAMKKNSSDEDLVQQSHDGLLLGMYVYCYL